MRARRVALLALCAVAGCAPSSADRFVVDWDREVAARGSVVSGETEAARAVETGGHPALPDFDAAGGEVLLSVEQAVFAALSRNRDLDIERLNPVIAEAFVMIERGRFAPEVFGGATFGREEATEIARSTNSQFEVRARDTSAMGGVRQTLPSGTEVELSVSSERDSSNRAPEQQVARVDLTLTQSLLRGGGKVANLASVRQAELDVVASEHELRRFIEALLADTEIAYWEYLLAQRTIEIFERSLQLAREQRDEIDQRIEVGVLGATELAAAESEVALREQALIDARSELESARLALLRLMNVSGSSARALAPVTEPSVAPAEIDSVEDRVALAQLMRPDLNEARLRVEQGRLETVRTRNGLLPRLDFFVSFGKTGFADAFRASFGELDGGSYELGVGVNFSQSLGDTVERGRHRAAIATRRQADAAVRNLEQLIEFDVLEAVNEVARSREQIGASATTRRLQAQTLEAERERFGVGASTSILVAQAQRDLLEAEIAEVEAVTSYRVALIRLYFAEGSLLERRGVGLLE